MREGIARVSVEPLRLLVERGLALRVDLGGIGFKKHAIADIDDEILASSRALPHRRAPAAIAGRRPGSEAQAPQQAR